MSKPIWFTGQGHCTVFRHVMQLSLLVLCWISTLTVILPQIKKKKDHFQTLATGVPKLKTWLGTQRVNLISPFFPDQSKLYFRTSFSFAKRNLSPYVTSSFTGLGCFQIPTETFLVRKCVNAKNLATVFLIEILFFSLFLSFPVVH